ncbi:MAG: hypothetical protein ACKOU7_14075 [Ferruginibacter sp.]
MKNVFLFLVLAVTSYTSFSQYYILDKRSKIKKNIEKYYEEHNNKYVVTETDSTLTYMLRDSLFLPATNTFYFNNLNRCIRQDVIFSCDSCLQKSITESLGNKFIKWKKAGAYSYYAGFPYNVLMEPVKENGLFTMRYTHIKRKDLKNNKEE